MQPSEDNFEHVKRHTVRDTDDYLCQIDEFRSGEKQVRLCHVDFKRHFTASVAKRFWSDWQQWRSSSPGPLYAVGMVQDAKWRKFVGRLGFRPVFDVVCRNGETRTLFINA